MKKLLLFLSVCASVNLLAQSTNFYGVSNAGGIYGGGTVFKVDGTGNNFQKEHDIDNVAGGANSGYKMVEAPNGKLYGHYQHTIYEYDPTTNIMLSKYEFNGSYGTYLLNEYGKMILAPNNKFYGIVNNGYGTNTILFEYDYVSNTVVNKYNFGEAVDPGEFILRSNNTIFGITLEGGQYGYGMLFEYDFINDIFTPKVQIDYTLHFGIPGEYIVEAPNGKIYGTFLYSPTTNYGGIFEYDTTSSTLSNIYEFTNNPGEFQEPKGITSDNNGNLYLIGKGCAIGYGGIGKYNYNTSSFSIAHSNTQLEGTEFFNGIYYLNNSLYVSSQYNGANMRGTILKYNITGNTSTVLHSYTTAEGSGAGGLQMYSDGKMYVFNSSGGYGYLNSLDTLGNFLPLKKFHSSTEGLTTEGFTSLNNKLYGMGLMGGSNSLGTIFELDPATSVFTKLYDFVGFGGGTDPSGQLLPLNNKLIGNAAWGGAEDYGQMFEFDPATSTYTSLADFSEISIGGAPTGYMAMANNNKIYGVCNEGGLSNKGTLYEFDPTTNNLVKRYDFSNPANGQKPVSLMKASNGKLYGITKTGGTTSDGVLFEFTPPSTYVKKISFDSSLNAERPCGVLLEGQTGILYGLTPSGGIYDEGTIYKYDITSGILTRVIDFDSITIGGIPTGKLTLGANNKMYGTTIEGGNFGKGVLFEYDYVANTITVKHHFNGDDGNWAGNLTLVCGQPAYDAGVDITTCAGQQLTLGNTPEAGYSYSWTPTTGLSSAISPNPLLTVQNNTTTYHVTENYLSCVFYDSIKVTPLVAPYVPICMTTVDSADVVINNHNVIYWDKTGLDAVDSFFIYREITTNVYNKIAAVSFDSLSEYHDHVANPNSNSFRYKISALDTCGNEGPLSDYHETIHLQYLGNGNLSWNLYDIENAPNPVSFYDILRDDNNTSNFVSIAQISGNATSYTDINYALFPNARYRVKNVWSFVCTPTQRLPNGDIKILGAINTSRSNIRSPASVIGIKESNTVGGVQLLPNPFNDRLTVSLNSTEKAEIEIYNELGQLMIKQNIIGNGDINTTSLSAGVYMVSVKTTSATYRKKLVKAE